MILRPAFTTEFPGVIAAMSTRLGGPPGGAFGMNVSTSVGDTAEHVAACRERFARAVGFDASRLVLQQQVHGDRCVRVDAPQRVASCDALVTDVANVVLGVRIADCQPVLVADPVHHAVGAIHAGWRGAAAHIVLKTLRRMRETFGTAGVDVRAWVGPAASVCCYEVDAAVAARFPDACVHPRSEEHAMLDLKHASLLDFRAFGVPDAHVEISPYCPMCAADVFHSWRRDGPRAGRMLAVIGMRN